MRPSTRLALKTLHALALGVLLMILLPTAQVSANGPHVRSREVFAGPAGPYEVRVLTAPVVGTMHMTISVVQLSGGYGVTDARVQVMSRGPQGATQVVGPVAATRSLSGPNWYGVSLPIGKAGEWMFTLSIESSRGKAMVDFPVNVQELGGINWGIAGVAALVLAVAAWWALSWMRGKGSKPQTGAEGRKKP